MDQIKHLDFFGLKLSVFETPELLEYVKGVIKIKEKAICYGYSFGTIPYFKEYPDVAYCSNQFEISLCDGRGLYLMVKLLRYKIKSDISIPNFSMKIIELANENHFSIMLIGSSPENNKLATENIRIKYPGAIIYDGYDGGYFSNEDQIKTVDYINKYKPDILFLGVSLPKKERFAYRWKDTLEVSLIIPFGGTIDILSGKSKPIPRVIKKMALGSIWRFIQEPRRLFKDSILNSLNVLFLMIPNLLFNTYILRKEFSIPKFYNRNCDAPIK
jgi:N-acetylglucosaminyldiphosphoundecaprenol N-acetyl-beta-D-mannosaminyltransferase